jgi:hypothetical protein
MAAAGGGNGGGGREIEAGRAFVALGLKDTVSSGLDKLRSKLKNFAEDARKEIGKGFGTGIGINLSGLLGSGVTSGIKLLGEGIKSLIPGTESAAQMFQEIGDAIEKSAKETAKLADEFKKVVELSRGGAALAAVRQSEADSFLPELERWRKEREAGLQAIEKVKGAGFLTRTGAWAGSGIGLTESRGEVIKAGEGKLKEIEARIADLEARRSAALEARMKIIDPTTDPAFLNKLDDLSQAMADAQDVKLKQMGEFERAAALIRRENEAANEATQQRLKDLQDEARLTDRQLKAAEERARIAQDFASEMRKIEFDRITKDFAPGARGLAGMIDRGWSNEQILEAQERMRSLRDRGGTMAKGMTASVNAALSLGVADQWKAQEKLMELTNDKLEEMRQTLDGLAKNLAMR